MQDCDTERRPISDINDLYIRDKHEELCHAPYREIIGSLNYCATVSKPDITFAVNRLAEFNQSPLQKHWVAAKKILRYLKGTIDRGIVFRKTDKFNLIAFSDSDCAGELPTRRSTSGIIVTLAGRPIIYKSKTQSMVALRTTEAEFIASCMAAKEIAWIKTMFKEMVWTLRPL